MGDLFNNKFSSSDKQNEQRMVIAFIHVLIMLTLFQKSCPFIRLTLINLRLSRVSIDLPPGFDHFLGRFVRNVGKEIF